MSGLIKGIKAFAEVWLGLMIVETKASSGETGFETSVKLCLPMEAGTIFTAFSCSTAVKP